MQPRKVTLIAVIGVLASSLVTLPAAIASSGDVDVPLKPLLYAFIIMFGWLPYLVYAQVSIKNPRLLHPLKGGLLLFSIFDVITRYLALYRPRSSTSGVAIFLLPIYGLFLVPLGGLIVFLISRITKADSKDLK